MRKVMYSMIAMLIVLSACGNEDAKVDTEQNQNDQEEQQETKDDSSLDDSEEEASEETEDESSDEESNELDNVVKHFKENGFDIGEEAMKAYDMVGAKDGFGIELDGTEVELYQYEPDSSDLENIKENNEYDMDGFTFSAIANGDLVLIGHDEHPEEKKVVETFNSY